MELYVFDLDDTILDNAPVDHESFAFVARRHGLRPLSKGALVRLRRDGALAPEIFSVLLSKGASAKGRSSVSTELLVRERKRLLATLAVWRIARLKQGVKTTLRRIVAHGGDAVILTRKDAILTRKILDEKGIGDAFARIITSKNKHAVLRRLAKTSHPTRFVFVSDTVEDLAAARRVPGIEVYCMASAYRDPKRLAKDYPVITTMTDVLR